MRINGFSGMDIDGMIKKLMEAEKVPLDKLSQKKTTYEWTRDKYREMNSALRELDNLIFDTVGKVGNFQKKVASSSNESAVSVKATGNAADVNVQIEVKELATSAVWSGNAVTKDGQQVKGDAVLTDLGVNIPDDGLTIKVNGTDITLKKDDTINSFVNKINGSKAGVTALYDEAKGQFHMTSNVTGEKVELKLDAEAAKVFDKLGFSGASEGDLKINKIDGKDAKFTYNGIELTRSSNNFEINGLQITLKQPTKPGEKVNISMTQDIDGMVDTVKKFVDKYNEVIEKINGVTGETKYRDFPPLTDEQKEGMSEKQIELWEKKAMSGLLKNDSILTGGLASLRTTLYKKVDGAGEFDMLSKIGITTGSYADKGKLVIDENKLRAALTKDAESVGKLFTSDNGLVKEMRATIKTTMSKIESKGGSGNSSFISKQIAETDKRMTAMKSRLQDVEARYYKQFSAMENAMAMMNQQSANIMSMFPS